ncbi:unnamed protein product [Clonostachys solani]|uniref:Uncharacterized protein n=1 Tax=Clonostachys solani TaxID=160281 RepID=A0A9N9Z107_9HYPO|nr:unnamed protein product [Clonostachys solani]
MATSLGLSFARNHISYFAVPAAFACAHIPHLYSVVASQGAYDNSNPRALKDSIASTGTLDEETKQRLIRAKRASENNYETIGLFAAGVAAANQAGAPTCVVNALSWGYVGFRVVYNFVYINLGGIRETHWIRSAVWSVCMWSSVGLFVAAGIYSTKGDYQYQLEFENI